MIGIGHLVQPRLPVRQHGRGEEFEVVQRCPAIGVIGRYHFALFGDPEATMHGPQRLRGNRPPGGRPAPADRSATAVKEDRPQVAPRQCLSNPPLRLVQLPGRTDKTAILVAVGIAQHHLDGAIPHPQTAMGQRDRKEIVENVGRVAQIRDRLEQRHDAQVQRFGAEPRMARQKVDAENIVAGPRHRQDEGADGIGVVRLPRALHQRQQVQHLARVGVQPLAVDLAKIGRSDLPPQPVRPRMGAIGGRRRAL